MSNITPLIIIPILIIFSFFAYSQFGDLSTIEDYIDTINCYLETLNAIIR